jgi:cobyrinic acid a,c-diamide synthase
VVAIPRLVIAGTASGVGKTTVATGLMAAFAARGLEVAGFKAGPDFIDPSYHALATGRPGRNLDAFLSGPELVGPLFAAGAAGAGIAIVEGVMGLFDGASGRGELASTAQVAKLLDAPVVLVVDAASAGRSVAATVHGFATFDPAVRVAGVIANRVGSARHAEIVAEALAGIGVPLLGVLRRDPELVTPSRHLGLVPAAERDREARHLVTTLGARLTAGGGPAGAEPGTVRPAHAIDLDALMRLARTAPDLAVEAWEPWGETAPADPPVRVAVAGGPAFTFLYQENLELLTVAGAELFAFDPVAGERLPAATGALYLGGGFPEVHAEALAANEPLRREIATFAATGRPVLAECGGLLYLCRSLDGKPMCGVLDAAAVLRPRLTLGYREATAATGSPYWAAGAAVRGHEFHHSEVTPGAGPAPAWTLPRPEGFVQGGVHASYLHTHWAADPGPAARLVAAARRAAAA